MRNCILSSVILCVIVLIFSAMSSAAGTVLPAKVSEVPASCGQLISVQTGAGHVATLSYWEKKDGSWILVTGQVPAVIGYNGPAAEGGKREGDGKTPRGIFAIRSAFGVDARLQTGLDYFQATANDKWVDDVNSPQYNRHVRGPVQAASWEELLRNDTLYRVALVIEYNTSPVVKGHGSAIFLHVKAGMSATAGCVAIDEPVLRDIASRLSLRSNPYILIY